MRWTARKSGTTKTRRKFCLFPKQVGQNVYWLEFITIRYSWRSFSSGGGCWDNETVVEEEQVNAVLRVLDRK